MTNSTALRNTTFDMMPLTLIQARCLDCCASVSWLVLYYGVAHKVREKAAHLRMPPLRRNGASVATTLLQT